MVININSDALGDNIACIPALLEFSKTNKISIQKNKY